MENPANNQHQITREEILLPLANVLETTTPNFTHSSLKPLQANIAVTQSLNELFPEQEIADKNLKKAKEILGDLAKNFSDSELKDVVAQVEYLVESWLDDFERDIFDGQTLRELLHERGGV